MRLRLFSLSEWASKAPVIFDRFPASVADPDRRACGKLSRDLDEACLIEELDGTLYAIASGGSQCPRLNGRTFEATPLLPGDRLTLGATSFVVSYERMTSEEPAPFPGRSVMIDESQSSIRRPFFDQLQQNQVRQPELPV